MKHVFRLLLIAVLTTVASGLFAQDNIVQPEHEKRVYVDKENARIYVWRTGLYLYVGTENDDRAAKYQLLNSASAGMDIVEPFYLDLEGLNTIIEPNLRNRRIAKDKLSEFRIYADWSSPNTKVSASVEKFVRIDSREIRGAAFDLSLESQEKKNGSGVQSVYYSLNDAEYVDYNDTPKNIVEEGLYTFRYYAVDNVGNVEPANTKLYGLDLTPPVTNHRVLSGNVGDILSPRAVLNLIATDEMAGVEKTTYKLDGGNETAYRNTISVQKVEEGDHTLTYNSIDRVDNLETENTYAFYLDRTPPVSSLDVDVDRYDQDGKVYVSGRSKITISAVDEKVDVKNIYYNVNKTSDQIFSAPFPLTTSATNHSIVYWADDVLLNKAKPVSESFILDIVPPSVFPAFEGPHYIARNINYINATSKVVFKTSDDHSGLQSVTYSLNGGEQTVDQGGFSLDSSGDYDLEYSAKDNVNNVTSPKSAKIHVDSGQPQFDFEFGVKNLDGETVKVANSENGTNVFPEKVYLYLYGTDDHSGIKSIRYSINGGVEQVYSSAIVFEEPADYTVSVRVIDNVDNEVSSSINFSITK